MSHIGTTLGLRHWGRVRDRQHRRAANYGSPTGPARDAKKLPT